MFKLEYNKDFIIVIINNEIAYSLAINNINYHIIKLYY